MELASTERDRKPLVIGGGLPRVCGRLGAADLTRDTRKPVATGREPHRPRDAALTLAGVAGSGAPMSTAQSLSSGTVALRPLRGLLAVPTAPCSL